MANEDKALARFEDLTAVLEPYKAESYWRLVPTTQMERSPLFRPALAVVTVNASDPRDVYDTPGSKDGSVCLHTQALERIGNALGIDWIETRYDRQPEQPFLLTAHVSAEYIDSIGQRRRINASATSDLRDGSVAARVLGGGLQVARQFIAERTEARARNRVVRKVTGMPTSFKREELRKPFVAVRWRLDESDPDVKRALIAQGVGATDMIFGRDQRPALRSGAPIDAGHEGPEAEVSDADFRERQIAMQDEPPIPDEQKAAPTAAEVADAWRKRARTRDDHNTRATDEQLGALAYAYRDALAAAGIGGAMTFSKDELGAVRRSLSSLLFGVKSIRELQASHVALVIEATSDAQGQRDLRAAFEFALVQDPALAALQQRFQQATRA